MHDVDEILGRISLLLYTMDPSVPYDPCEFFDIDTLIIELHTLVEGFGQVPRWDLYPIATGYYLATSKDM